MEVVERALPRMIQSQKHRGPDGEGAYVTHIENAYGIGIGHNRLAVLDTSDLGSQPMKSSDGRYILVYNGEIYNYLEIAAELGVESSDCRALGDTAVVLRALARWGPSAFERFNGMWAIALFDRFNHTLLVSRDRLGIKPLYTMQSQSEVYFGSEVKAILVGAQTRLRLNATAAVQYLTRGLLDTGSETFFTGISSVEPGTWSLFDLTTRCRVRTVRYWTHPFTHAAESTPADPNRVRSLLMDSVRLQLRSHVPVGVLLSGGIDSSAILAATRAWRPSEQITSFSVISDDPTSDESRFVSIMSNAVRSESVTINVSKDPALILQLIPEATWSNDQPLCGASDIGHLLLMRAARGHGMKVLLSGQGSDEQFGGYHKFFWFHLICLLRQRRLARFAITLGQAGVRTDVLSNFRAGEALRYVRPSKLSKDTFIDPRVQSLDQLNTGLGRSYGERECQDLLKLSLPQLLHFEDRLSMSQSVEVRVPFLDHRLVELAASISSDEKFAGGWSKSILRTAMRGLVPDEIRYRRDKKGFNVPEHLWMRGDFAVAYAQMLRGSMLAETHGLIDQRKASELFQRFSSGRGFLNARHFFRLYLLEAFLQRFDPFIAR